MVLTFLDQFVDLAEQDRVDQERIAALADNGADVKRTHTGLNQVLALTKKVKELEAQLAAAQKSRLEQIAEWAVLLTAEGPLLTRIQEAMDVLTSDRPAAGIDVDVLAKEAGVDPKKNRSRPHVWPARPPRIEFSNRAGRVHQMH